MSRQVLGVNTSEHVVSLVIVPPCSSDLLIIPELSHFYLVRAICYNFKISNVFFSNFIPLHCSVPAPTAVVWSMMQ